MLETCDPAKVEKLRTCWIPEEELINLQIQTIPVTPAPGDNSSYTYEFRYLRERPSMDYPGPLLPSRLTLRHFRSLRPELRWSVGT